MGSSNNIRELREKSGLTLSALSSELKERFSVEITPDAIAKYERGDRQPKFELVSVLSKFFGVPPTYLMGKNDDVGISRNVQNIISILMNENDLSVDTYRIIQELFSMTRTVFEQQSELKGEIEFLKADIDTLDERVSSLENKVLDDPFME